MRIHQNPSIGSPWYPIERPAALSDVVLHAGLGNQRIESLGNGRYQIAGHTSFFMYMPEGDLPSLRLKVDGKPVFTPAGFLQHACSDVRAARQGAATRLPGFARAGRP
jgi:hypothetical protein